MWACTVAPDTHVRLLALRQPGPGLPPIPPRTDRIPHTASPQLGKRHEDTPGYALSRLESAVSSACGVSRALTAQAVVTAQAEAYLPVAQAAYAAPGVTESGSPAEAVAQAAVQFGPSPFPGGTGHGMPAQPATQPAREGDAVAYPMKRQRFEHGAHAAFHIKTGGQREWGRAGEAFEMEQVRSRAVEEPAPYHRPRTCAHVVVVRVAAPGHVHSQHLTAELAHLATQRAPITTPLAGTRPRLTFSAEAGASACPSWDFSHLAMSADAPLKAGRQPRALRNVGPHCHPFLPARVRSRRRIPRGWTIPLGRTRRPVLKCAASRPRGLVSTDTRTHARARATYTPECTHAHMHIDAAGTPHPLPLAPPPRTARRSRMSMGGGGKTTRGTFQRQLQWSAACHSPRSRAGRLRRSHVRGAGRALVWDMAETLG